MRGEILAVPAAFLGLSAAFDWPRTIDNFDRFLRQRWHRPLLKGRAFPLYPHAIDQTYAATHLTGLTEFAVDYLEWLKDLLRADPEPTIARFLGDAGDALDRDALRQELADDRRYRPILRPDMCLTPDQACVLEFNFGTGLGGMFELEQMLGLYHDVAAIRAAVEATGLAYRSPLRALAAVLDEQELDTIALVDTGGGDSGAVTEYLNRFRRRGKVLAACTVELTPAPGGLTLDGCPVDGWCANMSPRGYLYPTMRPLWTAVKAGQIRGPSRLLELIAASKAGMAHLCEARSRGLLPPRLAAGVRRFLPQTAILRAGGILWGDSEVAGVDFCLANQENLVLKAATGEMGTLVHLGRGVSKAAWRHLVQEAAGAADPWIIQAHVESPETLSYYWDDQAAAVRSYACRAVVSPYIFGEVTAFGARLSTSLDVAKPLVAPEMGDCAFNYVAVAR